MFRRLAPPRIGTAGTPSFNEPASAAASPARRRPGESLQHAAALI
jgi:hypothetical protein